MNVKYFGTYDDLKRIGTNIQEDRIRKSKRIEGKNIFLSHSSQDHDLIPGVIVILENHGGNVYVDENDPVLDKSDFSETADRLRKAITYCGKFVLLVTPRTKDSKWIPWELGLGDGKHRNDSVVLFPSSENKHEQTWSEQEYLGLYRRIIWANFKDQSPEWLVYNHLDNTAIKLIDWLTK